MGHIVRFWSFYCSVIVAFVLASCSVPDAAKMPDVAGLRQTLSDLDSTVAPQEAARAAQIAYAYSLQLRAEYNVTDGPLLHNTKVNQGLRPRGLCWHWAHDLEVRLRQEGFTTLRVHRAIANHDNIRIQHSTVVISAAGHPMKEGIVLDPWRYGGYLFWALVPEDSRYGWEERHIVLANAHR